MKVKFVEMNPCHVLHLGCPDVVHRSKGMSVSALHVRLWATGGTWAKIPGLGVIQYSELLPSGYEDQGLEDIILTL